MDVLLLSRLQFALTIMFHYLFPPLTIGLSVVLVYLEGMFLWTGDKTYENAVKFWVKIFGLNFALGVVTGIVMEFEFGTNWAYYSRYVGDVFGSALAAEGIFAFFLESGFLAVLLFGWNRVSPKMHFFSTIMVCVGGIFSSIWIVVANSWQQTPTGHEIREIEINGQPFLRAEIVDFWAMVFNPSTVVTLVHVWLGAFILGAFFVMSISAYYLLKGRHVEFAKRSFTGALVLATVSCFAQMISGHFEAETVAHYQPAKLAALEGHYVTGEGGTAIYIVGWPNEKEKRVDYGIAIPGMLSYLVNGSFDKPVNGLDKLEPTWGSPPVWITFQAYHAMGGIGVLFTGMTVLSWFFWWRGTLFNQRWLLWFYVFAVLLAFAANELGWVAAEVGRQPWIVYPTVENGERVKGTGLRTEDGISESVKAHQVLSSIIMFGVVYLLLFCLWIFLLNKKIQEGPEAITVGRKDTQDISESSILNAAARRGVIRQDSADS